MKIEFIQGMWAYTDTGERISVKAFKTQPSVGDSVKYVMGVPTVMGKVSDSDCVNGVCPVK